MRTFIETSIKNPRADAIACLDLSSSTAETRSAIGPGRASKLKKIINHMWRINYDLLPDDQNSTEAYQLSEHATDLSEDDRLDAAKIRIERGKDGLWRFSQETVAAIDPLYIKWHDRSVVEGMDPSDVDSSDVDSSDVDSSDVDSSDEEPTTDVWLMELFPVNLWEVHFLIPDYQWICLLILIISGFVVDLITRSLLRYVSAAWFKYAGSEVEEKHDRKTWKPLGLLAQALVWYNGARLLGLPLKAMNILLVGLKLFTVVAGIWTAFLLIDLLSRFLARKALSTDTKLDDLLVPLVSRSLKIFVVCIGILTCAQVFDLPIAGLLGGLGIGGMGIAFAAKDTFANIFGSITVLVDRPFEIGDWIITDGAEGMVEAVGFRSTRIRTFYNSQITLPNSRLTTAVVDNMGRRRYRRVSTTLGLQYDSTPEQIDAFCEGVREIIRRHPYTRKDYYHVYLNNFGASSLDVMLYCFWECPDWSVELREKHRLFLDIIKLATKLGVSFAFPTRTLYMFQEQHGEVPPAMNPSDASSIGQRAAAQITGPTLSAEDRPGSVKFLGPSTD